MTALFIHYMAPIMFGSLVVFLLLGYPVAFSLAANGLLFAFIGIELGLFRPDFLQALPERVYGVMNNDTLLAIPFFTFMGLVLERSGMAEDLLETIGQLFGSIRGGIAYAVVFVGALLAATTGVVAASVISMGLISLPIMLRYGYDRRVASGVIAASGTLAQIIPPSLVLIVMADQLGRSVGDMYEGAFIPGIVLALLYAGYIFLVTVVAPKAAPGLPLEAQTLREVETARHPLILPLAAVSAAAAAYFFVVQLALFDWTAPVFATLGASELVLHGFWFVILLGDSGQAVHRHHPDHDAVAVSGGGRIGRAGDRGDGLHHGEGRRRLCRADDVDHRGGEFRGRCHQPRAEAQPAVQARRAGGVRDGAAARPDLPGARHHLHRRRDADRGRRDGRRRRDHPGADEAAPDLRPDQAGGGGDREALRLRGVHPGRRARVLADLLRRQRPPLGRGTAGRRCPAARSAS